MAVLVLASAPFPFVGRETTFVLGLPSWLWWSFGVTALLSAATAWGIVHLWDGDSDA